MSALGHKRTLATGLGSCFEAHRITLRMLLSLVVKFNRYDDIAFLAPCFDIPMGFGDLGQG